MKLVSRHQRRENKRRGLHEDWLRRTYPTVGNIETKAARLAAGMVIQNIVEAAFHLTYEGENTDHTRDLKQG